MRSKITAVVASILFSFLAFNATADTYVDGYQKRDGTYVQPHHRSDRGNSYNNYSRKGNVNPYTGKRGYKNTY